jgi:cysteine-rich repeat protein
LVLVACSTLVAMGCGDDDSGGNDNNNNVSGVCGNDILEAGEDCDDGNTTDGDGCSSTCQIEPASTCGDGTIDYVNGEQCDDGNTTDGDGCSSACQIEPPPTCGDGNVDYASGEECDDGNTAPGDGCSPACLIEPIPTCGDGNLDIADGEECDDGNTVGGDGCSPTCQLELVGGQCGNSTQEGLEVCDDGNLINGDGCNPTCNNTTTTTLFVGTPGVQGLVDGVGSSAQIGGWGAITVDANYIYYADSFNNIIRRIEISTATITTIAGDAVNGNSGYVDDPDGLTARFSGLESIATNGSKLWVSSGRRIREIDLTPPYAVTSVAGDGNQGHTDGIGTAAQFDDLRGLIFYNGHVYLLDANGGTLRRFDPVTQEVVTLAGTAYQNGTVDDFGAAARFISPRYMASDNSGMLYIADTNGYRIRSYNTVTTEVRTFAGAGQAGYVDGIGTAAEIHRPRGMCADGTSVYWVEFNQHTIRQGVAATQSVTTLVGTHCNGGANCVGGYNEGVGTAALFDGPFGLAFHWPSNSIFAIDAANSVIRRIQ